MTEPSQGVEPPQDETPPQLPEPPPQWWESDWYKEWLRLALHQ